MAGCQGILLGRRTYEMFEPAWSVRTAEEDPGAPFMNDTTKYVVSSTVKAVTWKNSTVVGPYDPAKIRLWPQPVIATALANAFDGVIQPRVCRGRVLRERAIASSSLWVHWERSDDFGKY